MITISVIAHSDGSVSVPYSADFGEAGGSIGRNEDNHLVLPDPARHISRKQALVIYREGAYYLQNQGSVTGIAINGSLLGNGQESLLQPGDTFQIGAYTLQVMLSASSSGQPLTNETLLESTILVPAMPSSPADPFHDLIPVSALQEETHEKQAEAPTHKGEINGGLIPLDFDPFAPDEAVQASYPASHSFTSKADSSAKAVKGAKEDEQIDDPFRPMESASAHLPEEFHLELNSSSNSIDSLFDLQPGSPKDILAVDSYSEKADPLLSLFDSPEDKKPQQAVNALPVQRDDSPIINSHFNLPLGAQLEEPDQNSKLSSKRTQDEPQSAIETLQEEAHTQIHVVSKTVHERSSILAPENEPIPSTFSSSPSLPSPADSTGAFNSLAGGEKERLLQAFLQGAGVPELQLRGETAEEKMLELGTIFRTAVQGTVNLLLARAEVKRGLQAEVTIIGARKNNPLKFSPNAEVALAHLLTPQKHGFMSPQEAMQDAYDDLCAHQIASVAGMRAALGHLLQRFNPAQLEPRLTEKSVVDSLIPMHRKAKLWSLFESLYAEVVEEAEEDFHSVFGKAFLKAYEEQLDQLKQK